MAWLQQLSTGTYHISFRFGGRKFKRSLRTDKEPVATARLTRLEENIRLVESGRIDLPQDADIASFLLSDGKVSTKKIVVDKRLTLEGLFEAFFNSLPDNSLEQSTVGAMQIHQRHLIRLLGGGFPVRTTTLEELQNYVNRRSKEAGRRGERVTATTIKKELATFRTVWCWGAKTGRVAGVFPRDGIRFPKSVELPPFQTWDEIERQLEDDEVTDAEAAALWDCLYLRRTEIDEVLDCVEDRALYPFIYPMFVMAAHTGARRSELLRSQKRDFNLETSVVVIRERKRVRGRVSTRRVPMSLRLKSVMRKWLNEQHPGGKVTFCHSGRMLRSRREQSPTLTRNQAHDHFQRPLQGTKWEKVRGWHCFRHSFISNLASQGVDQRIIDDFVGHTTESMRRRYRHLFPDVKEAALHRVFG